MYIPPWTILSGLGTLTREEMCQFLPRFEDTTLANIAVDKFKDISGKLDNSGNAEEEVAFKRRLNDSVERIRSSNVTDRALRVRLWDNLLSAFEIEAGLPLSTRVANAKSAEIAHYAAYTLSELLKPVKEAGGIITFPEETWKRLTNLFSNEQPDFSKIVIAQAELLAFAVAKAAQNGTLTSEARAELVKRVRLQIEELPPQLRDTAVEQALKSGDRAIIGLLATGTSLASIGIAVNLAGFSAYILAAQASAIIPLLSGPAVVSSLFILANPFFIMPALVGGFYLAGKFVKGHSGRRLASGIAVHLALRGLATERAGLRTALDDFKQLSTADIDTLPEKRRGKVLIKLSAVQAKVGIPLPPTPWPPEGDLAQSPKDDAGSALHQILFFKRSGNVSGAVVVGGLTAGDILYDAVAIDPTVLRAVDFSRSEYISNIFDFAVFADRIGSLSVAAVAGAENNLRGYVAEQIVATRLVEQGHVVTFPETSNNPGFDLLVDGHAFQVKCLSSIAGLREHFERYPNMPVFANGELAQSVAAAAEEWTSKVFYVEGFDREITDFVMQSALDAGVSLGGMDVPYFAVAVSTAKNVFGWWKGQIPLADLPFSVVLDGAVKGSLSAAGGFSGNILGLLLFGPAGALVFGGIGGASAILGSHWTRAQVTRLISGKWLKALDETTDLYRDALVKAIQAKIDLLNQKSTQIMEQGNPYEQWFLARVSDDVVALAEQIYELQNEISPMKQPERAKMCLRVMTMASVHPWTVREELSAVMGVLKDQPSMTAAIKDHPASHGIASAWDALKSQVTRKH